MIIWTLFALLRCWLAARPCRSTASAAMPLCEDSKLAIIEAYAEAKAACVLRCDRRKSSCVAFVRS